MLPVFQYGSRSIRTLHCKEYYECRTQKEVYNVVRDCLVSRTVYLDLEEGYYNKK